MKKKELQFKIQILRVEICLMEEEYNLIYTFHLQTIDQKLMYCTHEAHAHS